MVPATYTLPKASVVSDVAESMADEPSCLTHNCVPDESYLATKASEVPALTPPIEPSVTPAMK